MARLAVGEALTNLVWARVTALDREELADRRKAAGAERTPANKLSDAEREAILAICNQSRYQSLPPSQIVPRLADEGRYIASESSFYRVLRDAEQVNRRGRAQAPRLVPTPDSYKATAPNQVWSWDITFLASSIRGAFYRLYMVEDIFSRKIVGWEPHMTLYEGLEQTVDFYRQHREKRIA